jgi:hypothetical protein
MNIKETHRNRFEIIKDLPRHINVCEIGVLTGVFSQFILDTVAPEKLTLIDPWFFNESGGDSTNASQHIQDGRYSQILKTFDKEIKSGAVEVIRKKSSCISEIFTDSSFDFMYIDGSHSYHDVKKDLENCFNKTKVGGAIGVDDYHPNWIGVYRAVQDFIQEKGGDISIEFYSGVGGGSSPNIFFKVLNK